MGRNIVSDVIDTEDMLVIRNIAQKYDMTPVELGRFIAKSDDEKGYRFNVRLSAEEYGIIEKRAALQGVSKSKFCSLSVAHCIKKNKLNHELFLSISGTKSRRDKSLCVTFQNPEDFETVWQWSKEHSVKLSAAIRYCALTFKAKVKV